MAEIERKKSTAPDKQESTATPKTQSCAVKKEGDGQMAFSPARPKDAGPRDTPAIPPESQFPKEMREQESAAIKQRREALGKAIGENGLEPRIGLALSGGGIRSATFCLGVLQAMASQKWISKVDYLSTVSGGGYVGSFLGRMFTRTWINEEKPDAPEKASWPPDIARAITTKGKGAPRVEAVLDDHRSTPLVWLRESGRYLAPTGGGDSVLAGAVALRNEVAVLVVVITSLLALFLIGATARAALWQSSWWQGHIEIPLMSVADKHWWWSPLLILPALSLLLFALPLGWSYWMAQKDRARGSLRISPWVAVALIYAIAVFLLACDFLSPDLFDPTGTQSRTGVLGRRILEGAIAASSLLTIVYYQIALRWKKLSDGQPKPQKPLTEEQKQNSLDVVRNRLSKWFTTALVATAGLLVLAVMDSFGQMIYAIFRGTEGPYFKTLMSVTGAAVLFALARRIKLLFGQLSRSKAVQVPVSVLATIAAIVATGALLVSVSTVANGFAWAWGNPAGINPVNGTYFVPADMLWGRSHQNLDVKLTQQNLIQVTPGELNPFVPVVSSMSWRWSLGALVAFGTLASLFGQTLTFLNLSSHQTLYGSRITRAYQGASNPERWFGLGQRIRDALPSDDVFWRDYRPHEHGGPLHIVNVTLNETIPGKSQVESRDRHGMGVAVGPIGLTIGIKFHALWNFGRNDPAPPTQEPVDWVKPLSTKCADADIPSPASTGDGHAQETDPKKASPFGYHPLFSGKAEQQVERLCLRQWIGISGAAFTTGLGRGTSVAKSLLLGLTNIRLGYWWDTYITPKERMQAAEADYVKGSWLHGFLGSLFPVQAHLYDEMLAKFHGPNSRLWYLSDGGHFENTGAYELIRRRVPCIVVCDCGCDPQYSFEDLAQLIRLARVDFGAEIEFLKKEEWAGIKGESFGLPSEYLTQPTGRDGAAPQMPHALLAWVWYPDSDNNPKKGGKSLLVILKPGLSGDEPLDVAQYQRAHPAFPQEPTLDQFFNDEQWESYRKLGRHIGEQIFTSETPEWLKLVPTKEPTPEAPKLEPMIQRR